MYANRKRRSKPWNAIFLASFFIRSNFVDLWSEGIIALLCVQISCGPVVASASNTSPDYPQQILIKSNSNSGDVLPVSKARPANVTTRENCSCRNGTAPLPGTLWLALMQKLFMLLGHAPRRIENNRHNCSTSGRIRLLLISVQHFVHVARMLSQGLCSNRFKRCAGICSPLQVEQREHPK